MPRIFPSIIIQNVVSSGSSGVPSGSMIISDAVSQVAVATVESNATPTDATLAILSASNAEANAAQTEVTKASIAGTGINESSVAPSEARTILIRSWVGTSADNDSSRTTPANVLGANNGTVATLKTALQTGDTTNPVTLTAGSFSIPSTGTWTSKALRVYFQVAAAPGSDTIKMSYTIGGVNTVFYTAAAAVNNLTSGATYDLSSYTLAQLSTFSLTASYQSSVVMTPTTTLTIDAACVELVGTL